MSPTHFLVSLFVLDFLEGKAQECFLLCRLCLVKIRATPLSLYHCIGFFFEIQLWLTEGYFYFFIFILWFGLHFLDCALAFYSL